jgi:1-acyl-sn-glycerol-3-phosphate acyltransferase
VLLTRLGVPWLWGADVEKGWVFMRFNVVPITTTWLAPGSYCYGLDRLPQTGGAVCAMNHLSAIDPPLVGSFSNRAIWYMTKSELLEIPVIGEALSWAGGSNSSTAVSHQSIWLRRRSGLEWPSSRATAESLSPTANR